MTPESGVGRGAMVCMALPLKGFPVIVALNETQRRVHPLAVLKTVPGDGHPLAVDIERDLAAHGTFKLNPERILWILNHAES